MFKRFFFLFVCFVFRNEYTHAQNSYNFDFETLSASTGLPEGIYSNQPKEYSLSVDSLIRQHGKYSVSLEQKDQNAKFGAFSFSFEPRFSGKKLTLKGYIKTENVSDGFAGLWMRVDGNSGVLSFDNMQEQNLKGTNEWKEYTISIDFDEEEAKSVYIGALLAGKGKIWLDNFHLLMDEKDISLAPVPKKLQHKADLDTAFLNGSGVHITELNKMQVNNLANLGMLWGFLKYYHPAIGNGQFNWDAELFRILPKVLGASSKSAFSTIVENWVNSLGRPVACDTCSKLLKADGSMQSMPDYGWIFQKNNLGKSLTTKLEDIKNNRHHGKGYYIDEVTGIANPVFKNEKPYYKMSYPDAGYRLLSLFRYWNIIQYFFPDKYLIGEDWNPVLEEFIPKFIGAKDTAQYTLVCLELIARVHDTHANIWGRNDVLERVRGIYRAPVQAKMIENKLVVTGFYIDTLGIKDQIKVGDVITKINGESVERLILKNLYLTPASNYETQLRDLPAILLRTQTGQLPLEINRDGKLFTMDVKTFLTNRLNMKLDYDPNPADSSYKIINGNIGYIFPGKYRNRQLDDIKKAFAGTKGMIIDMRCYPSEFMPFTFGAYIKSIPSPFVKFTSADLDMPGSFSFGDLLSNGEVNFNNYKAPIVIIVNATTQSQAEYTTMAFQSSPNVTVIGSMTAGADGNVSRISLPGGILTAISGLGVYYPDGSETQRKGVKIDMVLHPTIQGIKDGRDEILEKAIEMINTNKTVSKN
ncbi:MAG TPA: S41 family peptidase [Puia sp.]|nr:S41 family peptidase [Puia sp.]